MKSSFKYVIVLVILSLSGLFIYQLFWITGLYHSRQKQNQEEIRMAIKNADHIELFNRADFLSRVTHRQRETSAIADTKGGAALSTRFPDKDSVIPELSVQPLDTNIYHPRYRSQTLRNEAGKMLKSTAVEVGNDFRSLGELGLQMQQALHEVIDSVKPVDLAKFDSILSSHLQKRGLDIRHHTEMWNLEDSSIIASSVPADLDKTEYDLHKWEYTTYHKRAYLVYTEPTRWDTIRMMSGILFSSFLILLILLIPFTRFLVGKSYGTTATIVPLTIAAIPFIGRMVESSLNEVDPGVIEAARSMGASNLQIVFRVMLVEARTSLISGATIVTGTILGYSAMAGTVGGGGLGDIAVRYGYNRWQTDIMLVTVILLVVLVQIFQTIGMFIANKLDKRK